MLPCQTDVPDRPVYVPNFTSAISQEIPQPLPQEASEALQLRLRLPARAYWPLRRHVPRGLRPWLR